MTILPIQLFFVYMLLNKYSIDIILLKDGSFALLATLVGQEKMLCISDTVETCIEGLRFFLGSLDTFLSNEFVFSSPACKVL